MILMVALALAKKKYPLRPKEERITVGEQVCKRLRRQKNR